MIESGRTTSPPEQIYEYSSISEQAEKKLFSGPSNCYGRIRIQINIMYFHLNSYGIIIQSI